MSVMVVNLSPISSGIIRLLLGRMAGLAEIKKAWSMERGAGSRTRGRMSEIRGRQEGGKFRNADFGLRI